MTMRSGQGHPSIDPRKPGAGAVSVEVCMPSAVWRRATDGPGRTSTRACPTVWQAVVLRAPYMPEPRLNHIQSKHVSSMSDNDHRVDCRCRPAMGAASNQQLPLGVTS
jgi:hypothetical protein